MMQTAHGRKMLKLTCIVFVTLGLLSALPLHAAAQDSLTLSINRNVGMAFGSFISGTFTLSGSGPVAIQNLTVYFNEEQVHFVEGNSISWVFNTGDYPGGTTNITLIGIDNLGVEYSASRQVSFIDSSMSTTITLVIIALVVILILAKYGPRLMKLRKKN